MLARIDEVSNEASLLLMARFGHAVMPELSPVSGVKQKSDFGAARAASGPGADIAGALHQPLAVESHVEISFWRWRERGDHRVVEGRDLPHAGVLDEDAQA